MAEYVLSEDEVRAAWVDREYEFGDTTDRARADFDRFIARVRRDAAREALGGLAADALRTASNEDVQRDDTWANDARLVARSATEYRDTHYPEETP